MHTYYQLLLRNKSKKRKRCGNNFFENHYRRVIRVAVLPKRNKIRVFLVVVKVGHQIIETVRAVVAMGATENFKLFIGKSVQVLEPRFHFQVLHAFNGDFTEQRF